MDEFRTGHVVVSNQTLADLGCMPDQMRSVFEKLKIINIVEGNDDEDTTTFYCCSPQFEETAEMFSVRYIFSVSKNLSEDGMSFVFDTKFYPCGESGHI